jgi:hypothetical protein
LGAAPFGQPAGNPLTPAKNDPNELKPTAPSDPNELKPAGADSSLPPPTQVNEIQQGQSSSSKDVAATGDSAPASDQELSSSKKKKKTGLKKLIPF